MKKLKKLSLKKEVVANLNDNEMKSLEGGIAGSRVLCTTNFNTGNCYQSKSCESIICIPCDTSNPV